MKSSAPIFDFLKFCLHDKAKLPASADNLDWQELFNFGQKQSIVGVLFHGIKRLKEGDPHPSARVLAQFGMANNEIVKANKQVYSDAYKVTSIIYRQFGHRGCVLKGQGNALMYPDPYMRSPGDIDLWIAPNEGESIADLMKLCRQITPGCEVVYHHSHNDNLVDTFVELHFRPSYSESLRHNKRLQKYFADVREEQFQNIVLLPDGLGKICVPTDSFNRIFQLSHIMKHFLFEGIGVGLRHIIDYFFLLRRGISNSEKEEFIKLANQFGMYRFARGLMYVLSCYLGLEDEYLLVEPDKSLGEFIIDEIIKTGNFGKDDDRFSGLVAHNAFENALFSFTMVSRMIYRFPAVPFQHISWVLWWHFYYKKKIARTLRETK